MYVRFFSFFPVWCGKRYVWECASDTFRPSPPPVTPQTPPEGGQGGGFDWSVSDPPQHAAAHRATGTLGRRAKDKKGKELEREGGRIGSERRAKNPPHIVARGTSFLRKRAVLAKGEDCVQAVQGSRPQRSIAERIERGLLVGVVGGAYRYMAMSQYSVLWGCICSLSIASTSLYIRALEGSNPPPPP